MTECKIQIELNVQIGRYELYESVSNQIDK